MPLEGITCVWASPFLTYVGTTSFCVGYPDLTKSKIALLHPRKLRSANPEENSRLARIIDRWARAGWHIKTHAAELRPPGDCDGLESSDCAVGLRYFGDRHCLSGRMDPVEGVIAKTRLRWDVLAEETVMWWRGGTVCGPDCHGEDIRFVPGYRRVPRCIL